MPDANIITLGAMRHEASRFLALFFGWKAKDINMSNGALVVELLQERLLSKKYKKMNDQGE